MKPLKHPLAALIGALALSGCQGLSPGSTSSPSFDPELAKRLVDGSHCQISSAQLADFTVSERGNLWPRMRAGYALPEVDHPRVQTYLNWYAQHPHYMDRVVERGRRYLHHIVQRLEAEDMPTELALLPIVESAFDPFAYSHGQASGIWQFVPATGSQYGLKQNWWYDGRRDVVASTDAALRYLKYLHELFDGDWLLALASYNTGQGNVMRRVRQNERLGKPTDFWSLDLPRETRAYVPQLLALSKVVAEPEQYGLNLKPVPDQPYFEIVKINSQIDLAQAAELAGLEVDELYMLNAGYNRWATDPDGPHRLLVPATHAPTFRERLAEVPEDQRVGWQRYQVASGDSLITIARRHRTSVKNIQQANDLNGHIIRAGQTLLIPTAKHDAERYAFSAGQRRQRTQDGSRGPEGTQRIEYQVRPGDSFWSIARRHDTTVGAVTNWNGMAPGDTLKPGETLTLWTDQSQAQANSDRRSVVRKVHYRVRKGDSLARIASQFNLSIKDIQRWNTVSSSSYIHPGQSLTLYVDVTQ